MTVKPMFKVVRPIVYDNQDEDWEYSTSGSCVVVSLLGRIYVVTALHVPKQYKPSQILIPYEEGSEYFLPIKEAFNFNTTEQDDTDHKDVLFLEVWQEKLDMERWNPEFCFNLAWNEHAVTTSASEYWVSGYPHELNEANYEDAAIYHQAAHIPGRPLSLNRFIGVDEWELYPVGGLKSYQGLSGGGAFSFTKINEGRAHVRFEGMILRATVESQKAFIMKSGVIKSYIVKQQAG